MPRMFGYMADKPGLGWNAVFIVAIAFGILGTILLLALWNAPADGYKRARQIIERNNLMK